MTPRLAVLASLLACLASQARAQDLPTLGPVGSFWASGGVGVGLGSASCDGCLERGSSIGPAGQVAIGIRATRWLDVGAEVTGWWGGGDGTTRRAGTLVGVARVHPFGNRDLFLSVGAGWGHWTERSASDLETRASGLAWQLGAGYEIGLSRYFSLVAFANYARRAGSEMQLDGVGTGRDLSSQLVTGGVALRWRWWPLDDH